MRQSLIFLLCLICAPALGQTLEGGTVNGQRFGTRVAPGAAAVGNGVTVSGSSAGSPPTVTTDGVDTSVPLNVVTKGGAPLQVNGVAVAPVISPAFTGAPTAPTQSLGDNTTALATDAFVMGQGFAPLASPTFTGTPSAPSISLPGGASHPAASTLAVYEQEIAWTPTPQFCSLGCSSTGWTFSVSDSIYSRIGKLVFFRTTVHILTKGTASGAFSIGGLPYAPLNSGYPVQAVWNGTLSGTVPGIYASTGSNIGASSFIITIANGTGSFISDVNFSSSPNVTFSVMGSYPTS